VKSLICCYCSKEYVVDNTKFKVTKYRKKIKPEYKNFCGNNCKQKFYNFKNAQEVICKNCNKKFLKPHSQIKKTRNNFCSNSCSATYNNTHKTTGNRRSKLEFWLEAELSKLYPELNILYCDKNIINSELDIYIPSLKLAFELNGIFHYEPIFGEEKLKQIKNNDKRKFQACLEKNIELCIIDTSNLSYFKIESAKKYLNIIIDIININWRSQQGSNL
jgi:hypothetical protein